MAGVAPAGPVSGVAGLVFVDPSPEAPPEVVTGNPGWPQPGPPGYQASPLRYPGQLWSMGYGEYPQLPAPETDLVDTGAAYPAAGHAGPGTPYYDATPDTHAGPWPHPADTTDPDQAAYARQQSAALHGDGLDNRKPGLGIAAVQDTWSEYYNGPVDGVLADGSGQDKSSAGWGSTDISSYPANTNPATDFAQHFRRRVARGHNLPMDFLWLPGSGRPLINTAHGLQALPVAAGGPYEGQDPAYGYGTAGAVLTVPASDYQPAASPYLAPPLSQQNLMEGPL